MNRRKPIVVMFLVFSLLGGMIQYCFATQESWNTKNPMPTPRYTFGVATVNGKIYAIGGMSQNGTVGTNEEYDPETDIWTTKSSMPTPRYYFAVAVYQNRIYTFGGLTNPSLEFGTNTYVGVTEVYDPQTDTWKTKTQMPTNRSALCANVVDNKIYLISGLVYSKEFPYSSYSNTNQVYDPETDSWNKKASIPTAVCSYTSEVVDTKIYVIGGSTTRKTDMRLVQVYNTQTNRWTEADPLLEGVRFAGSGVTSGEFAPKRIYVIGGGTTQAADGCNLTQIYDPETGDWTYGTQMPTIRSGLRVAVVDDVLYAIGGFNTDGDNILAVNEQYTPTGYITEHPSQGIPPTTVVAVLCATVAIVAILVAVILKKQKNHSGYRSAT